MKSLITESAVEECSLDWVLELGYEVLSGLTLAPGEPAAERADYKQIFLLDRLQTKLEDLNPKIPPEGLDEASRKIRLLSHPTLIENNRAFHSSRHLRDSRASHSSRTLTPMFFAVCWCRDDLEQVRPSWR